MVKVSILYPNNPGARFDFRYYTEKHMPRAIDLLSAHAGYKGVPAFLQAFMPHAPELQGDIPSYTDLQPVIQISEVLIST